MRSKKCSKWGVVGIVVLGGMAGVGAMLGAIRSASCDSDYVTSPADIGQVSAEDPATDTTPRVAGIIADTLDVMRREGVESATRLASRRVHEMGQSESRSLVGKLVSGYCREFRSIADEPGVALFLEEVGLATCAYGLDYEIALRACREILTVWPTEWSDESERSESDYQRLRVLMVLADSLMGQKKFIEADRVYEAIQNYPYWVLRDVRVVSEFKGVIDGAVLARLKLAGEGLEEVCKIRIAPGMRRSIAYREALLKALVDDAEESVVKSVIDGMYEEDDDEAKRE